MPGVDQRAAQGSDIPLLASGIRRIIRRNLEYVHPLLPIRRRGGAFPQIQDEG